jgi:regulator of protease activity HflC (stomatin/prohibitin superfamily)
LHFAWSAHSAAAALAQAAAIAAEEPPSPPPLALDFDEEELLPPLAHGKAPHGPWLSALEAPDVEPFELLELLHATIVAPRRADPRYETKRTGATLMETSVAPLSHVSGPRGTLPATRTGPLQVVSPVMGPILAVLVVIVLVSAASILARCMRTVRQGNVAVVTAFGKYRRVLYPGLNFLVPIIETISTVVSVQNRSVELSFQAITSDQANVYFKALLLFSVLDQREETIQNVAFKFIDETSFNQTLVRTVEGAVRSYVATRKQAEILSLRGEIVQAVKGHLDANLSSWGYHLQDMQMNDVVFDQPVMESMARVVASQNLLAAAENEGRALLVTKTKAAEADGNAIRISAEADRTAQKLRGEGIALFREEAARGISVAAKAMESAGLSSSLILFQMWTESIKHMAEKGHGNVIFLDGSNESYARTLEQMTALQMSTTFNSPKKA